MKGLVFLTTDNTLSWRDKSVIDENPAFVRDNYDFILQYWNFDTDDLGKMRLMFSAFRDLKLSQREVLDLAKSIGFDLSVLRSVV